MMKQLDDSSEGVNRTQTMRFHPFVFTGKERDEETGYGYFGARYMDHDLMTLWLSVDPMADKYPSISPYAYCAWNPVKLVDPKGREIYYKEGQSYYIYKKDKEGKYGFFNCKTDEAYSGNNQQYINDLTNALGQLKEGKHGRQLVFYFEGHTNRQIYISDGVEHENNGNNIYWSNTFKPLIPVGSGPSDPVQTEYAETFICLGHEMVHAHDVYKYGEDFNNMTKEAKEQSAMLTENLIRREHGFKQRTYYGLKGESDVDYNSYPAVVFPSNQTFANQRNNKIKQIPFDF